MGTSSEDAAWGWGEGTGLLGEGDRLGPCSIAGDGVTCQASPGSKATRSPQCLGMETHWPQMRWG